MRLVPREKFCIVSNAPPRVVAARLTAALVPHDCPDDAVADHSLIGWFDGYEFAIQRVADGPRREDGPRIASNIATAVRGRLVGTADGCRLEGTMMLQPVLILGLLWMIGAFSWAVLTEVLRALHSGHWPWSNLLGLTAMLDAFPTIWLGAFWLETRRTRDVLYDVLGDALRSTDGLVQLRDRVQNQC